MITMGRLRAGGGGSGRSSTVKSASLLLSPSSIHFLSDAQTDLFSRVLSTDLERNITDVTRRIAATAADCPKIQAVQKDGHWFTLNNSQLALCRRLEHEGCCRQVKVDVVALKEVPVQLRGMMVLPDTTTTPTGTTPGTTPAASTTAACSSGSGRTTSTNTTNSTDAATAAYTTTIAACPTSPTSPLADTQAATGGGVSGAALAAAATTSHQLPSCSKDNTSTHREQLTRRSLRDNTTSTNSVTSSTTNSCRRSSSGGVASGATGVLPLPPGGGPITSMTAGAGHATGADANTGATATEPVGAAPAGPNDPKVTPKQASPTTNTTTSAGASGTSGSDGVKSKLTDASMPRGQQQEDGEELQASTLSGDQDMGRSTGKGYQKLETAEPGDKPPTKALTGDKGMKGEHSETSDDSDNSDDDDSDSECDWSQEEGDSSEGNSSEDDHSTDDERECLL